MPDEGHDSSVLPDEWRYLPFLALPDGAHNYQEGRKTIIEKLSFNFVRT